MSKHLLPDDHPYMRQTPGVSPFDLAASAIAYRRTQFAGWKMKDDDEDLDENDDEDDDDDQHAAPDETVKVGDKVFKVGDLQKIMAREKRQGKRSGQSELLKDLGFDSVDAAKAALEKSKPKSKDSNDDEDDEAATRAAEREASAAAKERAADEKARRADLRGVLREFGVSRDDLDDAFALLDRAVDSDYDDDELEEAVEALKDRRPSLFGDDSDGDDTKPKPRPKGQMPAGRPRKKASTTKVFGAGGVDRAKRKGWIKDS